MVLRRPTGVNIASLIAASDVIPDQELRGFFAAAVRRDGARAAAWLVFKHRRSFVAKGEVEFTIQAGVETPPYFRVAVEFLKRRRGWTVVTLRRSAANDAAHKLPGRVYRVTWLGWAAAKQLRDAREEARS